MQGMPDREYGFLEFQAYEFAGRLLVPLDPLKTQFEKAITDVETMRSTILNRLSHAGTSTFVKSEVEFALATVEALQSHTFPKAT